MNTSAAGAAPRHDNPAGNPNDLHALAEAYAGRWRNLITKYRTADPTKLRDKFADLGDVTAAEAIAWFDKTHRPRIHRGIVAEASDVPYPQAHRIADGVATSHDLLGIVDVADPGCWWYSERDGFGFDDARDETFAEETVAKWLPLDRDFGRPSTHFELPVVLSGYGPVGWTSADNPDDGLMGNSYIPDGGTVRITAIHYSPDGDRWHSVSIDHQTTIGNPDPAPGRHANEAHLDPPSPSHPAGVTSRPAVASAVARSFPFPPAIVRLTGAETQPSDLPTVGAAAPTTRRSR